MHWNWHEFVVGVATLKSSNAVGSDCTHAPIIAHLWHLPHIQIWNVLLSKQMVNSRWRWPPNRSLYFRTWDSERSRWLSVCVYGWSFSTRALTHCMQWRFFAAAVSAKGRDCAKLLSVSSSAAFTSVSLTLQVAYFERIRCYFWPPALTDWTAL